MSRSKRLSGKGFTLIEVTLAIVIGVIMIAGATLLYNQSKISSGNTRANSKVLALQQLVEEYAANNQGTYPDADTARVLWKRKRPDDYLKSPWGGQVGPSLNDPGDANGNARGICNSAASNTNGQDTVTNAVAYGHSIWVTGTGAGGTVAGINTVITTAPLSDTNKMGGLSYALNDQTTAPGPAQNNSATASVFDVTSNTIKTVRGYAVWVYDQSGTFPNFATGGKEQ